MTEPRTGFWALAASAAAVAVSVPTSTALQRPDLAGLVLVVSGGLALLLARSHLGRKELSIVAFIVALTAVHLLLHALWHRFDVAHDWQEPVYVVVVVAYLVATLWLSSRLLRLEKL